MKRYKKTLVLWDALIHKDYSTGTMCVNPSSEPIDLRWINVFNNKKSLDLIYYETLIIIGDRPK